MSEKVLNLEQNQTLTGHELKLFYNNLSKFASEDFRNAVMERCDWSYPVWRNRLHSLSKITKLEAEAILVLMSSFKSTQP